MPCYADMIIKIKYVKQSEKDAKVLSVWALGTYPPGHEDNEMEVTLFLPVNPENQNPESQAMFRKDEYYSIGGKIIPGSYAEKLNQNAKLPSSNSTRSKLMNVYQNATNKVSENNPLK
ncbi:12094_t:CDS:2 [Gigaspora margarita]|uniref:12094_t:CDS:1 n=1 Tax=Gigaspora margarita TaxID=4874 RepID=A0ABN7UZD7_GIGMA|nr:12094_t:CDS:2 [Gigaspora margarita]